MSGTVIPPSTGSTDAGTPTFSVPKTANQAADTPGVSSGLRQALAAVMPQSAIVVRDSWITALTAPLRRAEITTPRRIAAFLGQCSAESGGFRDLEEDLSYSADRLCQVWPNRFPTPEDAEPFAFAPEALANLVYAGRMGNGDVLSGDGWRFRGRGLFQLTGKAVYEHFAAAINQSLDAAASYAASMAGGAESATWFWTQNGLNALADTWSINVITQRINGGMTNAQERSRLCASALRCLEA